MQAFVHERLQALQRLLARSSAVLAKYNRLDLDLTAALTDFLDDAIASYRALGRAPQENQLLALQAQFVSAQQGTHPITLERVVGHRRELQRAIALQVLQRSADLLRTDMARDNQALDDARVQLRTIVLLALRDGLLPLKGRHPPSQQQLDTLWRHVLLAPDIQLAARQVAMQLGLYDIQLLLAELILALRPSP